jgi:hypothetical protein
LRYEDVILGTIKRKGDRTIDQQNVFEPLELISNHGDQIRPAKTVAKLL